MTEHNEAAVINARPRIHIEGELRPDINTSLLDMHVNQPLSGMANAEIRIVIWSANDTDGGADFPFQGVELGQRLEISSSEEMEGTDGTIFIGDITAIEERYGSGAPQLVILAEDKLHLLARLRHNRTFEDMSIDSIIQSIASEANLTANANVSSETHTWHQLNESNLAFLFRLLSPYDIAMRVQGDELRVKAEEADSEAYTVHPQENAQEVRIIADLNHQLNSATVSGYNLKDDDTVNAQNDQLSPTPPGQTAADILSSLSWDAGAQYPQPFARTQTEGEAWAKARFKKKAKRFLHGDIKCSGYPGLHSGREIELQGVSQRLQGLYQIVSCTHHFSATSGYTTGLKVQRGDWG